MFSDGMYAFVYIENTKLWREDMKECEVLAVIPARSGSKSVVDKNIRLINGKPMIAYSIEHALKAPGINRVIVSTDSEKYAEIAKNMEQKCRLYDRRNMPRIRHLT